MKAQNKRSYPLDRVFWVLLTVALVGIGSRYIYSSNDASISPPNTAKLPNKVNRAVVSRLCGYDQQDLSSVVWSHRAHVENTVDGSSAAVALLLQAGIRNFDVDVSCQVITETKQCEFLIAHPVALAEAAGKGSGEEHSFQTVTAFLEQIFTYCTQANEMHNTLSTRQLHPLVTLEMKFDEVAQHIALVEVVQKSPLADRVAMIGADPQRNAHMLPHIKLGGIAAAYRSLPLTDHDYQWPIQAVSIASSASSKDGAGNDHLMLPVPPALIVQHEQQAAKVAAAQGTTKSSIATVEDGTQSIHLIQPAKVPLPFLQVYMPDIKLVTHPISWHQHTEKSAGRTGSSSDAATERMGRNGRMLVVAWVVDTPQLMWEAFEKGLDGVISNHPVELLEELSAAHRYHCE